MRLVDIFICISALLVGYGIRMWGWRVTRLRDLLKIVAVVGVCAALAEVISRVG
jgi:hypothetical protein